MNNRRYDHASVTGGGNLYVFGGQGGLDKLDSIESLNLIDKNCTAWQLIQANKAFTARDNPLVCTINSRQILICGGQVDSGFLSDMLIFEIKTGKARKIKDAPFTFWSKYNN